ncbi:MAG: hypothetical protein K8I60_10370, partial [Anaerolineae bacterium]|nr:hypothetical protein [Anaerolineae bacterium]
VLPADPLMPSTLEVVDLRLDHPDVIWEGEIEVLESVSPDGRYAAVITDDNGIIDAATPHFDAWLQARNPVLSFIDVSQRRIIYEMPYSEWFRYQFWSFELIPHETYSIGIPQTGVVWLNNNTCLVQHLGNTPQESAYVMIQLTDHGAIETAIGGDVELILPDSRSVIVAEYDNTQAVTYALYDRETREATPIFFNPHPNDFLYTMSLEENGLINLHISGYDSNGQSDWMNYILRIDSTQPG